MDNATRIVLPGDSVDPTALLPLRPPTTSAAAAGDVASAAKKAKAKAPPPLRLGPGLRMLLPAGAVVPTVAGRLVADPRKNLLWVDAVGGRYLPTTGDLVIGQVLHTSADQAVVALAAHDAPPHRAVLPVLAFAGASRKNRPALPGGTLVYARVTLAAPHWDTELACVDPATGKADGLGPLVGGTVFPVSVRMARRLLQAASAPATQTATPAAADAVVVLDALAAEGLAFETAVGRNGRLWVNSGDARTTVLVGRAVTATDAQNLDARQQQALVRTLVRGGGGGGGGS